MAAQWAGWLAVLGVVGCAPSPAPRPASAPSPAAGDSRRSEVKATLEAMLGMPYDVFTAELQSTYGPANQEMLEASRLFFRDEGRAFHMEAAPRARELFESAVGRVANLEERRAKALRALPILFIQLDYVAGKAENGLAMIAFSREDPDEMVKQLTRLLEISDRALDTIAQELRTGVVPKQHPQYRELQGEFGEMSAKSHLLLGLESRRRGDPGAARSHWQKGLGRAQSEEMRAALRRLLDGQ